MNLSDREAQQIKSALCAAKACLYCPTTATESQKESAITQLRIAQDIVRRKEKKHREKATANT